MEMYLYSPYMPPCRGQGQLYFTRWCVCVGTCACLYLVGVAIMPQTCLLEVPCTNHGCVRVSDRFFVNFQSFQTNGS